MQTGYQQWKKLILNEAEPFIKIGILYKTLNESINKYVEFVYKFNK